MTYNLVLTLHLIVAILFIATVYFRTFVVQDVKGDIDNFQELNTIIFKKARKYMFVSVSILLLTGVILFSYYVEILTTLIIIKSILGIIAVSIFFFAPKIIKLLEQIKWGNKVLHYFLFSLQIFIVIVAKFMFL